MAGSDLVSTTKKYEESGYVTIGYSKFKADTDNYSPLLSAAAQEVQADLVLSCTTSLDDREEILAQDRATPTISNTSGSGGYILSSGGRAPAASMGSSTAAENMVGPSVAEVIPQSQYIAIFMRKHVVLLGANLEPLDASKVRLDPAAHGLSVGSVVEGSPAALAGVLPGDILEAVDQDSVTNLGDYIKLIDAKAGKLVHLTLLRGGSEKTLDVQLNSIPGGP